ncbi:glycosyltransferase [Corynebacterium tapiri]|uniref:Glycosyl transferase family 28 C-terminal domain-containing protein n=1 Tax=Corynebacterium tapiri TaxID=1448266 RepID=A0A5C4U5L7_9CORY|nr:glycosyltransferase [Corynebacterium tapiri]TNL99770.1 hypothetical protein FHE74_01655 [Corynebacterium tapiri]
MIGIYAHHHGSGHLYRCRQIAQALNQPSTIFSSREGADVVLPLDTPPAGENTVAPEAGGALHYAPHHVSGLRERMAIIAEWIRTYQPRAFYVDCSVEVALFVRLMGVPVITIAMPGARTDLPHQTAYRAADAIIACWPDWVETPAHLTEHARKLHAVGGISRLHSTRRVPRGGEVVVLNGAGGGHLNLPGARVLGGDNYVADPTEILQRAGLVIAAAGQNSVADLASTATPAVVIAQDRPFGEQHATAEVLKAAQLCVVSSQIPAAEELPDVMSLARKRAQSWALWQTAGAAERAAAVIEEVAG